MFDSESSSERRSGAHRVVPSAPGVRPDVTDYVLAMSHELKAPLNAVIGMSGLLLEGDIGERQRQYANSIHAAGESLGTILNDLLDLSRIVADRLLIEPIDFDLKSMVEETAKVLSPRAAERGLALRVEWRPELSRHVIGDPGRTRQVLGNLVGHAMNSTSQGEVVVQVSPDGENENGTPLVRFAVEDTGIGLPQERLERVFNEYVPVDASPYRSFGVSGLGLRVSAELVHLMHGEIGAESEIGKGSRFWFRLPMAVANDETDTRLAIDTTVTGGRALLVEADLASRERFAAQLQEVGWDLAFGDDLGSVEAALRDAIASGSPFRACILSDYAVRPSHAELAMHLKADDDLAKVALVMATAVGSPGEAKRLWHAGYAAYLRKPVPQDELVDMLVALETTNPDGRGPALITRHSLAEARNAQSATQFDVIDAVLASLTTPAVKQVLVVGTSDGDQIDITEVLAQCDLAVDPRSRLDEAIERLGRQSYELILIDADRDDLRSEETLSRVRGALPTSDTSPQVVALTVDPSRHDELVAVGFDGVLGKPIRRADLDRLVRRAAEATAPEASVEAEIVADTAEVEDIEPVDEAWSASEPDDRDEPDEPAPAPEASSTIEIPTDDGVSGEVDPPAGPAGDEAETVAEIGDEPPAASSLETNPAPLTDVDDGVLRIDSEGLDGTPDLLVLDPQAESTDEDELADAEVEVPEGILLADLEAGAEATPVDGFVANEPEDGESESIVESVDLAEHPLAATDLDGSTADGSVESIDILGPGAGLEAPVDQDAPETLDDDPPRTIGSVDTSDVGGETDSADPDPPARTLETDPSDGPIALLGSGDASSAVGTLTVLMPGDRSIERTPVPGKASQVTEVERVPTDLAIVGDAILEQLASSSRGFAPHLAATFLREAPQRIAEIEQALIAEDADRVGDAARHLKGMGGLLGAARLGAWCDDIVAAAEANDLAAAADLATDVEHAFVEIRMAVERVAPPESQAPEELPAISASFMAQLSPDYDEGTRVLATKMVDDFRAEAPTRLEELTGAIADEDAEAVQRLAPTLKGMSSLIGAEPLAKLCAMVEAEARLRRVGSARRFVDQLNMELTRVLDHIGRSLTD